MPARMVKFYNPDNRELAINAEHIAFIGPAGDKDAKLGVVTAVGISMIVLINGAQIPVKGSVNAVCEKLGKDEPLLKTG